MAFSEGNRQHLLRSELTAVFTNYCKSLVALLPVNHRWKLKCTRNCINVRDLVQLSAALDILQEQGSPNGEVWSQSLWHRETRTPVTCFVSVCMWKSKWEKCGNLRSTNLILVLNKNPLGFYFSVKWDQISSTSYVMQNHVFILRTYRVWK